VNFSSNTAGHAGAAIYAADISVCTFTSMECEPSAVTNNLTQYEKSIFKESPFHFRSDKAIQTLFETD